MQEWEYAVFSHTRWDDDASLNLTELGRQGWELVNVAYMPTQTQRGDNGKMTHHGLLLHYLKRPKSLNAALIAPRLTAEERAAWIAEQVGYKAVPKPS